MNRMLLVFYLSIVCLFSSAFCEFPEELTNYFQKNNRSRKIIIDTDAGGDDAVALILGIKEAIDNANVEIVAITCVAGNTALSNVVVNVLKTLNVTNSTHIPVYMGADRSILLTPPTDNFYGLDGFGDFEFPDPPTQEDAKSEHAVSALTRLARENVGELTILAIGPLTNIALAMRFDPMFRKNIKDLYVLGGSVNGLGNIKPGVEFNFYMDPEANFIVFNETYSDETGPLVLLSWDTIAAHTIDLKWRLDYFGNIPSPLIEFINKVERISLESETEWRPADAILLAAIIDPLCVTKTERFHAIAVTNGEARGGMLVDRTNLLGFYKNIISIDKLDMEIFKNMILKNFV